MRLNKIIVRGKVSKLDWMDTIPRRLAGFNLRSGGMVFYVRTMSHFGCPRGPYAKGDTVEVEGTLVLEYLDHLRIDPRKVTWIEKLSPIE